MQQKILRIFAWSAVFTLLSLPAMAQRGTLLQAELAGALSSEQIGQVLEASFDGIPSFILQIFVPARYDVQAYKLTYETIAPNGNPVVASGVVFVPQGLTCTAPMAVYLHGTLTSDSTAPSTLAADEALVGWALATDGYLAVLPDYLGLGLNNGPDELNYHPYHHADTEASATIDMMRAARQLAQQVSFGLNSQIFLSGYSQGGHAVLATQREIQKNFENEFDVDFASAGSGAYALSSVQKRFVFRDNRYSNPSFLPYLVQSYENVYGDIYRRPRDIFRRPYDRTVLPLFDGTRDVETIDSQLPSRWKRMFRTGYLLNTRYNPFSATSKNLKKNNVLNWTPKIPMRLYFCGRDELVDKLNSIYAWLNFTIRGSGLKVLALPSGPFRHRECAPFVLLLSKIGFDLRRNSSNCSSLVSDRIETVRQELSPAQLKEAGSYEDLAEGANSPTLEELLREEGLGEVADLLEWKEEDNDLGMRLYPNPTEALTQLDLSQNQAPLSKVEIMDFMGRSVKKYTGDTPSREIEIDCRNLNPGLYLVRIHLDAAQASTLIQESFGDEDSDFQEYFRGEVRTLKLLVR